ncbi:oligoendopeptidase F [Ponticaulis sp.]|uniref:oligoendopeptidase F n=1 Tax=Ponticaulis sp. TaxID=2020902 RepID=UPI000B71BA34|nr:oligoendopeptidase F [Ponticaulis sp.]OUY01632.1 MAG: oligoendopeptidase F [Hyphomonadaceae bacterium TMED5]
MADFHKFLKMGVCSFAMFAAAGVSGTAFAEPLPQEETLSSEEAESSETYVWDLTDLYETPEAWTAEFEAMQAQVATLSEFQGTLGESSESLALALRTISDTAKEVVRLYVYSSLSRDEDQRVPENLERFGRALSLYQAFSEAVSWMDPELLAIGEDRIREFMAEEPALEPFTFSLEDTLRQAPHTLDEDGEALLALAGLALSQSNEIYSLYANASIPWPMITLSDGTEVRLNQAAYSRYRAAPNREDRAAVFDIFWGAWNDYEAGMGATLNSQVLSAVFRARARGFDSVLERNMFDDALPQEIYTQLVDQVNAALPIFHRYLELRGRMLGVEDLRYYDIYPPIIEANTGVFDLARSEEITFDSLRPFGEEYLGLLREGLDGDWMHSHPQDGKETGAYMSGSAYDVHPYVLLNHTDDFNSLSTFTHEWGHAVHTMLAREAQPFETAGYSTFIAEMASTINEILLQEYMVEHAETREEKLFYLGQALESLRGTFFRQTMFGEFELAIHEAAEAGEPLTGSRFSEIYLDLLRRYHGEAEGVMSIDEPYGIEWAYIPHFYYEFYVYQYATSISGAVWFAEQFLAGDDEVRENFLNVLRAGGSDHPHQILLNEAGLDMTQPDAYEAVVRRMTDIMDRMDALLAEED